MINFSDVYVMMCIVFWILLFNLFCFYGLCKFNLGFVKI
jgi:hypothetical protein